MQSVTVPAPMLEQQPLQSPTPSNHQHIGGSPHQQPAHDLFHELLNNGLPTYDGPMLIYAPHPSQGSDPSANSKPSSSEDSAHVSGQGQHSRVTTDMDHDTVWTCASCLRKQWTALSDMQNSQYRQCCYCLYILSKVCRCHMAPQHDSEVGCAVLENQAAED